MHRLDLDPALAAATGRIQRVDALDDDALVAGRERVAGDPVGDVRVGGDLAGDPVCAGDLLEDRQPLAERPVDEVLAVDVEDVEEPRLEHGGPLRLGAEPGHGVLERSRAAVLVERQRLAVEDEPVGREGPDDLDDLGHPVGDLGEAARVDVDVVAVAVDLDASAVELVLDGGLAGDGERRRGVGGGGGEHRQDRGPDGQADLLQGVGATGEGEPGGLAEVAAEHDRPAERGDRDLGGLGDGVDEHAFEGAGAHLADEDAGHERTARRRWRARPRVLQGALAQRRGTGAGGREQVVEEAVEVGDGEARRLGRFAHEARRRCGTRRRRGPAGRGR